MKIDNMKWEPYYSADENLRNNLRSVIESDMAIDDKINVILALNGRNFTDAKIMTSEPIHIYNTNNLSEEKEEPKMSISDIVPLGGIVCKENYDACKRYYPEDAEFLPCDGRTLNRNIYSRLFSYVGTRYGKGDGKTTFNIPCLSGNYIRTK